VSERPDAAAVADRALILYALVRRGYIEHVVNASHGDPARLRQAESARREQDRWLAEHALREGLTGVELVLFEADSGSWPSEAVHDALWRKESLGVLLWSLGHLDEIPSYGEEFDQKVVDRAITRSGSVPQFRTLGRLRADDEIERAWQEADTWFAATEDREAEEPTLASIAVERLRALSWLRGAGEPA
jgi:Domain of unknown function (DUF4272)